MNSSDVINILQDMKKRLDSIDERLDCISSSCNQMDTHISFIEQIYAKIRAPMDFLFDSIISPIMNKTIVSDNILQINE